jgi:monooxygenase
VIVTATGLKLKFLGGMELEVDGKARRSVEDHGLQGHDDQRRAEPGARHRLHQRLVDAEGDLTCEYVCRLLAYMDKTGARYCVPRRNDPTLREEPFVDFTPGYILRAIASMPKQGSKRPWRMYQNYVLDILTLRHGNLDDGTLEFEPSRRRPAATHKARASSSSTVSSR